MSSNWDEAIEKQQTINNNEKAQSKSKSETKYENWLTWEFVADEWDNHPKEGMRPWNYERKKLYKLLGIEVIKTFVYGAESYKTGEYQLVKTSTNTFDIKEKTAYFAGVKYYVVGVDTTKITDMEKFLDIKNRIDAFLTEAENEFKKIKIKSLIGISPSFFNFKDRIKMTWKNELVFFALFAAFIIPIPFVLIYRIVDNIMYNKKNESARTLVDAYFERVKEFEKEIAEIMIS